VSYELPGAILHQLPVPAIIEVAQRIFVEFASEKYMNMLALAVLVLLMCLSASYIARLPTPHVPRSAEQVPTSYAADFILLAMALLLFGAISVATDAGQTRLLDYEGLEIRTIPVYGYATILLVVVGVLLIWAAERGRPWTMLVLLLTAAPIAYEAFVSSKRQIFAPVILVLGLYFLYSPRIRNKLLWLAAGVAFMVGLFALQFLARIELGAVDIGDTPLELLLLPQLGEFIAVGSTSLYSLALVDSHRVTYGENLLLAILNSVPYMKLGTLLYPDKIADLVDFQKQIAPYGALSTLAEAWWTFQWFGVVIVGIAMGFMLRVAHWKLRHAFENGVSVEPRTVYWICLIATIFVKYRSGISDMIQSTIAFTLLYWTFLIPGMLLRRTLTAGTSAKPYVGEGERYTA
jgi:hypothetical protein